MNKLQVTILGGPVNFIPDDGVAGMGGVDADLVGAAGEGLGFDERKKTEPVFEFFENILKIDLGQYHRTFLEIRVRKTNRTKFLDSLKDTLVKKMDVIEE